MFGRPSIRARDGRLIRLDESPSVDETDEWLSELGCQKKLVGKTVQGRNINLYWMDYGNKYKATTTLTPPSESKSILFLSLVHGNEPMGLVSLLMGAKELAKNTLRLGLSTSTSTFIPNPSTNTHTDTDTDIDTDTVSARIYFLPIVNVDAYEINSRQGKDRGCHRMNLRPTCMKGFENTTKTIVVDSCLGRADPSPGEIAWSGGVDLNRNFPTDWENSDFECTRNYPGPHPLSEPETQAIASVVETMNITHAMSLHSMSNSNRNPLMIHPYASTRQFRTMDEADARRFRGMSAEMNQRVNHFYITGTAQEAIKYTAAGTTIDWMYGAKGITSYVLEVTPPCETRWCRGKEVYRKARPHAATMNYFVDLALTKNQSYWDSKNISTVQEVVAPAKQDVMAPTYKVDELDWDYYNDENGVWSMLLVILYLVLSGFVFITTRWRHQCRLFFYRFGLPKFMRAKDLATEREDGDEDAETIPLTTIIGSSNSFAKA